MNIENIINQLKHDRKIYEDGKLDMLEKIRTEILNKSYDGFELGGFKDGYYTALVDILNIVDKYKLDM